MTPHLLPLPTLHAAAPGVLDVIFGPDGDFEGAPNWHPPLWDGAWAYHIGDVPDPLDGLALDLRVPSVAARLAGLCARALGHEAGTWSVEPAHRVGRWHLRATDGRTAMHRIEGEHDDAASFLAALTLALAPRIAALGRTP